MGIPWQCFFFGRNGRYNRFFFVFGKNFDYFNSKIKVGSLRYPMKMVMSWPGLCTAPCRALFAARARQAPRRGWARAPSRAFGARRSEPGAKPVQKQKITQVLLWLILFTDLKCSRYSNKSRWDMASSSGNLPCSRVMHRTSVRGLRHFPTSIGLKIRIYWYNVRILFSSVSNCTRGLVITTARGVARIAR